MPLGKRRITEEELTWLRELGKQLLIVGTPTWLARRNLNIAIKDDTTLITLEQAKTIRALVGKLLRKRFPVGAPRFATSPTGPFPYSKRELA